MVAETLNPQRTMAELLTAHPSAARVLLARHMHCFGCVVASFETLEEACTAYGVPLDELMDALATAIENEENQ